MDKNKAKQLKKLRRQRRIRSRVIGTKVRPRLSIFKSNTSIFAQIIDDTENKTIVSAHTKKLKAVKKVKDAEGNELKAKIAVAYELGKALAEKAKGKKIETVTFDRAGNKYHGRVKAVADGARAGGLKF